MVVVITKNLVKEREKYLSLAKAFVEDARTDKGCHDMEVCMDSEKEDEVVFISKWESKDDFLNHVHGPSFAKHIPGMSVYYVSGTDEIFEIINI